MIDEKMVIVLVTGYRRTGKDSFFRKEYPWLIYAQQPWVSLEWRRISFAKVLKQDCWRLAFGDCPDNLEELVEDIKEQQLSNRSGTFRDLLIERAREVKATDPDYYARMAFQNISLEENIIVTDWRFQVEYDYLIERYSVKTVRLYRSDVPRNNIPSETELDGFLTDYLMVTHPDEFIRACRLFPQYRDYILFGHSGETIHG